MLCQFTKRLTLWFAKIKKEYPNIPTKHNIEPNQIILKGNNRKISVRIYVREIDQPHTIKLSIEKSQV